jgi:hypothetical protein
MLSGIESEPRIDIPNAYFSPGEDVDEEELTAAIENLGHTVISIQGS